jgi:hypothetical protein
MKNIIKKVGIGLLIVPALMLSVGLVASPVSTVYAAKGDTCTDSDGNKGIENADGDCVPCDVTQGLTGAITDSCASGEGQQTSSLFGNGSIVNTVINIMLFIIGILCVIMIIFGGIRYTISRGKDDEVKNAKNTILYSIVGLVIAIIAYALVNWVFTSIGQS